jgi:hypothetical protein
VKRKRNSQLCDNHYGFENGTRFERLLGFAAVTSGWPNRERCVTSKDVTVIPGKGLSPCSVLSRAELIGSAR